MTSICFTSPKSVSSHPRKNHSIASKQAIIKKFFVHSIKMLNLSLDKLKLIPKNRAIKGCKGMSKDELLWTEKHQS